MNSQELKNKISEEYSKVSVASRQHTFVNILKANKIDMSAARTNETVISLYKEFTSGSNLQAIYEVVKMLVSEPYKNEDLFWNCAFTSGFDGSYSGFVIC